jgi:hypothetical protein
LFAVSGPEHELNDVALLFSRKGHGQDTRPHHIQKTTLTG